MDILNILLISLFIEAIVNAIKPLWKAEGEGLKAAEIVAIVIGMVVAISCRINMLDFVMEMDTPAWMDYIYCGMTGIALGRGPSFMYDLWESIKGLKGKEIVG